MASVAPHPGQAATDIAFQFTDEVTTLRYEVRGSWCEMVPPPPEVMGPMLRILKEKAGLPTDAVWGEGEILLRTEKGPMDFRLALVVSGTR